LREAEPPVKDAVRVLKRLRLASIILPILVSAAAALYDYTMITTNAFRQVDATTGMLAEHAEKVLETNDLVLTDVAARIKDMDWTEIRASRALHDWFVDLVRQMPQLQSVFLVAPDGHMAISSRGFPMEPFDVSQRSYFFDAQAGNTGLHVSQPFIGMMHKTLAFTVSRRLGGADFDGVVGVTLSPPYFENFYQSILESSSAGAASLQSVDGNILVRYPHSDEATKEAVIAGPVHQKLAAGVGHAVLHGNSGIDGVPRVVAYRRLERFPDLLVALRLDDSSYLRPWYIHAGFLAAVALLMAGLLFAATTTALRRAEAERTGALRLIEETRRREWAEEALQQVQKMEALGRLTGGVAHDFNNLLAAVLGSLELAALRVTDPTVSRLLGAATRAAERGAKLTAQMLAFSRNQGVTLQAIGPNDRIRGMDEMLRRTLGPSIRVNYRLAEELWPATADPTQFELAVLNLAINARDAMPSGGILGVATQNVTAGSATPPDLRPGDYVLVSVSDNGIGMPAEVKARAFEPFYTTKGVGKGTGLGLSMVYGLAKQGGGTVTIDSEPEWGTTINLYLPRSATAPVAAEARAETVAAAASARILLVDDDADVREFAAEVLRGLGHEVVESANGVDALQRIADDAGFDLMIVDFGMPLMNGAEVATAVKQRRPDLPIIFVTGYTEGTALESWVRDGYRLLNKPFRLSDMVEAVDDALKAGDPTVPVVPAVG
jgi:signal transduction histidine kinase/ActR/RegA family two-component response regulator